MNSALSSNVVSSQSQVTRRYVLHATKKPRLIRFTCLLIIRAKSRYVHCLVNLLKGLIELADGWSRFVQSWNSKSALTNVGVKSSKNYQHTKTRKVTDWHKGTLASLVSCVEAQDLSSLKASFELFCDGCNCFCRVFAAPIGLRSTLSTFPSPFCTLTLSLSPSTIRVQ